MGLGYQLLMGASPSMSLLQPWTDISPWVKEVDTARGRSTELDDIQAGTATIILDNENGYFTPGKTVSQNLLIPNVQTGTDTYGNTLGFYGVSGVPIASSTSNPFAGANCLQVTVPSWTAYGDSLVNTDWVRVTPGLTYNWGGAVRNTVVALTPPITVCYSIQWVDGSYNNVGWTGSIDVTMLYNDGWHVITASGVAPAGAVYCALYLINHTGGVNGTIYTDSLTLARTMPFPGQITQGTPIRLAAVQNGNLLPYQIANVDHWNDQSTGDLESCGSWGRAGIPVGPTNAGAISGWDPVRSGLILQHSAPTPTTGSLAYIITATRITNLPPGTYTLKYVATGITYGSGATLLGDVKVVYYPTADATPTVLSTTSAPTITLTTAPQVVSYTFTIPTATTGLTGIQIQVTAPCFAATQTFATVGQFQLVPGTVVPTFVPGDACFPIFAGWADTWIHTLKGAAGRSDVELDCTDQLRRLGNLSVSSPYQAMVLNDPNVVHYWPFGDVAATTIAPASADVGGTAMVMVTQTAADGLSHGLTAGATGLLVAPTGVGSVGGVVNPNHQGTPGSPAFSSSPQPSTSLQWIKSNVGNCGAATLKAQYPTTPLINAAMPAVGTAGQGTFDCWVEIDAPGTGSFAYNLLGQDGSATGAEGFWVSLTYNSALAPNPAKLAISFNGTAGTTVSIPNIMDGAAHHLALVWAVASGSMSWAFYIDGTNYTASSGPPVAYATQPSQTTMIGADFPSGGTTIRNCWVGHISDVAMTSTNSLDITRRLTVGRGNYPSSEVMRFRALMDAADSDTFTDSFMNGTESCGWMTWASATISDALKSAAYEVGGTFYIGKTGQPTYLSRSHAPTRVVFRDSLGTSADDGLQFSIDGDHIINQVAITMPSGTVISVQSGASVASRGAFPVAFTVSYSDNAGATSVATATIALHAFPITRVYGTQFTCVNPLITAQALGLDVGSRVTLADLPDAAPAASMNWIVQSISITGVMDGSTSAPVVAVEMSPDLAP